MTDQIKEQDTAGVPTAPKPKRCRVRKYDPISDFSTNLLFEPLFPIGESKRRRKISFSQITLLRHHKDALEGKVSGIKAMIEIILENQKVRERAQKEREVNASIRFTTIGGREEYPCNADAALLILGVATTDRSGLECMGHINTSRPVRWLWFSSRMLLPRRSNAWKRQSSTKGRRTGSGGASGRRTTLLSRKPS